MQLFSDKRQTPLFIAGDEIAISAFLQGILHMPTLRAYVRILRICANASASRGARQKLSISQSADAMARELQIRDEVKLWLARDIQGMLFSLSRGQQNRYCRKDGRKNGGRATTRAGKKAEKCNALNAKANAAEERCEQILFIREETLKKREREEIRALYNE